ncbi:MAG: F0F1-type synthase, epsilon subunit [Verrucomicrobiota bacterium]|jgi:F-type H+-transporting ATPase subunit epsilon
MATLKLEILTPESIAYSGDVEMVVLPAELGEMGVYPMHVPLMTRINPGELVVTKGGQKIHLAIGEGFAEVTQTNVRVLVDMALEEAHIDERAAQEAVERAQLALKGALEKGARMGNEEVAAVQATLAKSIAQLKVKRRRHTAS